MENKYSACISNPRHPLVAFADQEGAESESQHALSQSRYAQSRLQEKKILSALKALILQAPKSGQ